MLRKFYIILAVFIVFSTTVVCGLANTTSEAEVKVDLSSTETPEPVEEEVIEEDVEVVANTPTPTPEPTETPVPEPTATPTEVIPTALTGQEAYDEGLELALAWQEDVALTSIGPTTIGTMQSDGTAESWNVQFWSESAGEVKSFLFMNGAFQETPSVAMATAPRLIPAMDAVIFDTKALADIAAQAGGQAYLDGGGYLMPGLTPYPLDHAIPTWYYNYFNPDNTVSFSVIIDARSGEVIQAIPTE
ncbi:MAG: hypothetical protein AAF485_06900 [Chloroflexota bacterium]